MTPPDQLLPKPAFGQACNGCGRCCLLSRCPVAELIFGISPEVCPALSFTDGRSSCAISTPEAWGDVPVSREDSAAAVRAMLGAGLGCDYAATQKEEHQADVQKDDMRRRQAKEVAALSPGGRWALEAISRGWVRA